MELRRGYLGGSLKPFGKRPHRLRRMQRALLVLGLGFPFGVGCVSERAGLRATVDGCAVADLAAALERARALPRRSEPIVIELAPGDHVLRSGLRIDASWPPLLLRAADPHRPPRILGGLVIDAPRWTAPEPGFEQRITPPARGHVVALGLEPQQVREWHGGLSGPVHVGHTVDVAAARSVVLVGDIALEPARWPNEGFAGISEVLDTGSVPRQAEDDVPLAQRVSEPPRGGTFVPFERERVARWDGERDLWAAGYWNWDWSDELLPVRRVDAGSGAVELALPHRYGLAARGKFAIVNALAELDRPWECWLDGESGQIYAWIPRENRGERVSVSLLDEALLTLDGASDVRIEGLRFECTRGAALVLRNAERVSIERCSFERIGTRGVDATGRGIAVRACEFRFIGGTGVRMEGGDRATLSSADCIVSDSSFLRCSELQRSYNPAVEIAGVGIEVSNNELAELPHFALTLRGNEHRIVGNLIHHAVQETGDAGAVYCGRDWTSQGNVLEGNLVHSIHGSDARFQNAFYMDDMASGITLRSNLVVHCNWGMLIGGGRDVHVERNAFVSCGKAVMYDARGIGWMAPHIQDPSTSTLHRRYSAMPVLSELWSARYPSLARYLSDRFGRPVGGVVAENFLLNSSFGRVEDRECVVVRDNVEETRPAELAEREVDEWVARARREPITVGGCTLGPVGPRVPVGAPGR